MKQYFVIIFFLALHSGIFAAETKPDKKVATNNSFQKVATLACTNGNVPKGLTGISCKAKDATLSCKGSAIVCSKGEVEILPKGFKPQPGLCGDKPEDKDDIVGCMISLVPATCVNPGK
ncbi:uncharacterized protein MELLADRAFT_102725 [Melampsora larici-populina 98AG31]|uniref:Secreted protein n=1 Tax=Melampsora larici-populina (strain 98AG31 / pathotype 3-4-7) TaxID=747676 RepID=F4R965_MELLP|nr:uncharacterized protein MELLADRAFT_102725 [Melampsora larici-populina 98AG31]EGG11205.1 secreted protein [Melampsora larici-populina 98AG31]